MNYRERKNLENRAWALIGLKRAEEAIPLFTRGLESAPDDAYLLCGLAAAYYHLKDYETALRFADRAVEADPEEEWGYRQRSYSLQASGRKWEALDAAEEACRLCPDDPDCLRQLVSTLLDCNKVAEAEEAADELLEIAPESPQSHIEMGLVYLRQQRFEEAEACNRQALELDPNSVSAMNNLGLSLSRQGKGQEVLEYYYQALRIEPTDRIALRNLERQAERCGFAGIEEYLQSRGDTALLEKVGKRASLKEQAQALMREGRYGQAILTLHQALALSPDDLALYDLMSEAYMGQQDMPRALEYADRAIKRNPKDWRGYRRRSMAYLEMSKHSGSFRASLRRDALDAIAEAVRLAPDSGTCLYWQCVTQRECELLTEAEQTARRLIEVAPEWWCSYQSVGRVCQQQGHWRVAEMFYRKALEYEPNSPEALNDLGIALWNQNRHSEARECFQKAHQLDPTDRVYRNNAQIGAPKRFFGLW